MLFQLEKVKPLPVGTHRKRSELKHDSVTCLYIPALIFQRMRRELYLENTLSHEKFRVKQTEGFESGSQKKRKNIIIT